MLPKRFQGPCDPTTARSLKTSLKRRLASFQTRGGRGIYVGAEERGPRPSSDRGVRIYRLAVPVLKKNLKFGHFTL